MGRLDSQPTAEPDMPRRRSTFCDHCGYAQRKRDWNCDNCGAPTSRAVAKDRSDLYQFAFNVLLAAGFLAWMYFKAVPAIGGQ